MKLSLKVNSILFSFLLLGKYFESYYVMLQFDKSIDKLVVKKHTIPSFVPLEDFISKYLNGNIRVRNG